MSRTEAATTGPRPPAQRDQHHGEQIQHRDIDQLEPGAKRQARQRAGGGRAQGPCVAQLHAATVAQPRHKEAVKKRRAGIRATRAAPYASLPMKQAKLTLLALGVVFGDIGTSPLYAVKETFSPDHGIAATHENILARPVDDVLVADDRRVAQVRDAHHARRQPRRGRHHGAHRARVESGGSRTALARHAGGDRHVRRGAVLRRRGAHPRDLGAVGGRGTGGRHAGLHALRRADRGGRAGGAVRAAGARHRDRGPAVRPGDPAVVPRHRRRRAVRHPARARGPRGAEPAARAALPHHARGRVLRRARRGGARRHRRRSAVRRHGAFRQGGGAHRLVQPGGAGAGAELLWPGRAVDGRAAKR